MERAIAQFNAVQFPPIGDFSVISMSFDLIDCLQSVPVAMDFNVMQSLLIARREEEEREKSLRR